MEWVETTAKTIDEAKDAALDQLGVAADEAEFDVVEEPKAGLFGRTRGEARVRARVKPTPVRPKQDRRRGRRRKGEGGSNVDVDAPVEKPVDGVVDDRAVAERAVEETASAASAATTGDSPTDRSRSGRSRRSNGSRTTTRDEKKDTTMSNDTIEHDEPTVSPQEVGDAAVVFMDGLVEAFGASGSSSLTVDGTELDVRVDGEGLGLLVGHGGRTLNAIQDLARVSAQRRLGDHETRLRIDVAQYRERRSAALVRFAADVAAQVRESGSARSLEPMTSADRKVIHDALNDEDGVESKSEGDDPNRRVVVVPV